MFGVHCLGLLSGNWFLATRCSYRDADTMQCLFGDRYSLPCDPRDPKSSRICRMYRRWYEDCKTPFFSKEKQTRLLEINYYIFFQEVVFDIFGLILSVVAGCVLMMQYNGSKIEVLFVGLFVLNMLFFLWDLFVYWIIYDPVICCWIVVVKNFDDNGNEYF